MNKKLIASLALTAAGVGMLVVQHVKARKDEEERNKRLAEVNAQTDKLTKNLEAIAADLDKKLENAKFWAIVTREDK